MAKELTPVEGIKTRSNYLRGTIAEGLQDLSTGGLSADDQQLIKFHGSYQQDDRDLRKSRRAEGLGKAYSFMLRIALPAGQRDGSSRCGWPTQIVGVSGSIPRSASLEDFETESIPSARWMSATSSSPSASHSG